MAHMGNNSTHADVVIIGAGAVGAATAYELARRGASVTVLEAGETVGTGCSYANAGLLAPSHVEPLTTPANVVDGLRYMFAPDSPFHVHPNPQLLPWFLRFAAASTPRRARAMTARLQELAEHSLRMHAKYSDDGMSTGYRHSGSMDVFLTDRQFDRARSSFDAGPSKASLLTAAEAGDLEPTLGPVAGAIHRPGEATCGSQEFVRAMLDGAERHGAAIHWGARVRQMETDRTGITGVSTDGGRFTADDYVIAAGLESDRLCRDAGIRMPLQGAKGYVVDLEVTGEVPQIPMLFKELKVVATPYRDRLRLSGTLELGGDPKSLNERRIQAIRDAGSRGLPRLNISRTIQTWAGQRPCTPDGVPVLGRSSKQPNLVVAAGHGMWGLVLGPVTGELVARGLLEAAPTLHEAAFSPDRFSWG
ncbi:FAD-dependent oxidoreductase [Arthrobacter pigmenti]